MNNQKALTKDQINMVGIWEGVRFYIYDYYHTNTSKLVCSSSSGSPCDEWIHVHSSEYYASLSEDQLATLNKVYTCL